MSSAKEVKNWSMNKALLRAKRAELRELKKEKTAEDETDLEQEDDTCEDLAAEPISDEEKNEQIRKLQTMMEQAGLVGDELVQLQKRYKSEHNVPSSAPASPFATAAPSAAAPPRPPPPVSVRQEGKIL